MPVDYPYWNTSSYPSLKIYLDSLEDARQVEDELRKFDRSLLIRKYISTSKIHIYVLNVEGIKCIQIQNLDILKHRYTEMVRAGQYLYLSENTLGFKVRVYATHEEEADEYSKHVDLPLVRESSSQLTGDIFDL